MRRAALALWLLPLLGASCATTRSSEAPLVAGGLTAHVRSSKGVEPARASVNDLAFLAGRWVGEGLGGTCEEIWGPPMQGVMLGTFRLISFDGPSFYEFLTLVEEDGVVRMRLKHLSPELVPWEAPEETTDFTLLSVEGSTAWFGGLTLHRSGDSLHVYVAMDDQGALVEIPFDLKRTAITGP